MNYAEKILELYTKFRQEIDKICIPEILKCVNITPIWWEGKQVGIVCYVIQPTHLYIDCVYVEPEYRRKGLAKTAVLSVYETFKDNEIRLHIINENKVAYDFWNDIFDLEYLEGNAVDTLYKVGGLKSDRTR